MEHIPLAAPGLDADVRQSGVYATELAMQLDKAIHNARAVDLEALCIMAGQKVGLSDRLFPAYSLAAWMRCLICRFKFDAEMYSHIQSCATGIARRSVSVHTGHST